MKRIGAIYLVLLLVGAVSLHVGGLPSFADDNDGVVVALYPPSFEESANISIPYNYYLSNINLSVAGLSTEYNTSAYAESVIMKLGTETIWTFQKTGFGGLGKQSQFSNGAFTTKLQFGENGGDAKAIVRIPVTAKIKSAFMEIQAAPPVIDTKLLNKFSGMDQSSLYGADCANAGDLNGDGYDDFIIGAVYADVAPPIQDHGHAYIYYGGPKINATPDLTLHGTQINDHYGNSVAGAGDVNLDGYDDAIVGNSWNNSVGNYSGCVYIYFGGPKMDNVPDIKFTGSGPDTYFGSSVANAGDVNQDGYDDIIIGAAGDNSTGVRTGRVYIYFGGPGFDTVPEVILSGSSSGDSFSRSSSAGDVNADGYGDVIVGASGNDIGGTNAGQAYVFFGGKSMDVVPDMTFTGGANNDYFGISVSGAGDVNDDGYSDVIVGAANHANKPGYARLYLGGATPDSLADANFTTGTNGDHFGNSVADLGDVNGDGIDDVAVGSLYGNSSYVYLGGQKIDTIADAIFIGRNCFGAKVAWAGDANRDGYNDILVGDYLNQTAGVVTGASFLYALHSDDQLGMRDIQMSINGTGIWKRIGTFNGSSKLDDFSSTLTNNLAAAEISGSDDFGNFFVDMPINVHTASKGNITLNNLTILYDYETTVPNFAPAINNYLKSHANDKDQSGNVTVPITINSKTPGRVRLFNLTTVRDMPPNLVHEIQAVSMDEDTWNVTLMDLTRNFQDDTDMLDNLTFSIVNATNATYVRLWITANHILSADAFTGDANDNWTGTVEATVVCADRWGQKAESNRFSIIIANVNDPPIITSTPVTIAETGIPYYYNITGIDGDNDPLTYTMVNGPGNMTLDKSSGRIEWLPRERGNHSVVVAVSDGKDSTEQNFTVFVPNKPPRITSSPVLNAFVGIPWVYHLTTEDTNDDLLVINVTGGIEKLDADPHPDIINITPTSTSSIGASIAVSDGLVVVYQNFTIAVTQTNRPPIFQSKADTIAVLNKKYYYNPKTIDPDTDIVAYSIIVGPDGMSIDPSSGHIEWLPVNAGNYTVKIKVSDGRGGEAFQEYSIEVLSKIAPTLAYTSPEEGQKVKGKLTVTGTVAKGSLPILKVQLQIDDGEWLDASGDANWTYTMDTTKLKNGNHTLRARAFDGTDYSDVVSRTIIIDNQKPTGNGFIPSSSGILTIAIMLLGLIGHRIRKMRLGAG